MDVLPEEPEEEILEMEVVPDEPEEEILEMEIVPDDEPEPSVPLRAEAEARAGADAEADAEASPAAPATGDLHRLRGFDAAAGEALARARITEIAHLSGHDAGELSERTGIPLARLQAWVQVADLVHEVGVPVEPASALVAAGVAGPKGLRDADADEVADRVAAFGGYRVDARDIKRWKRRA